MNADFACIKTLASAAIEHANDNDMPMGPLGSASIEDVLLSRPQGGVSFPTRLDLVAIAVLCRRADAVRLLIESGVALRWNPVVSSTLLFGCITVVFAASAAAFDAA